MAFPVIEAVQQNSGQSGTNWGSQSLTSLATIAADDLLVAFVTIDGANETVGFTGGTGGWTKIADGSTWSDGSCTLAIAYRYANGTDDALSITNGNEGGGCRIYRISGAEDPSTQAPELADSGPLTGGAQTVPVPLTTPTGGAKDYLWLAICAHDRNRGFTSGPTNYSSGAVSGSGSGGCSIGYGTRSFNASSQDPDSFEWAAADGYVCDLIAIHPAAVPGEVTAGDGTPPPTLAEVTASGAAKVRHAATAAVTIATLTAASAAIIWPTVYLNTTETTAGADVMTVTDVDPDGTSITFTDPAGGKSGSLFLGVENARAGIAWISVEVTDPATKTAQDGSPPPTLAELTSTSTVDVRHSASGTPAIVEITSTSISTVRHSATGTPTLAELTASGAALSINLANGTPSLTELTASGAAQIVKLANGTPNIDELTATGTSITRHLANGTPSIDELTASGNAGVVGVQTASADVSIDELTSSATATTIHVASSAITLDELTASGTTLIGVKQASGDIDLAELTASGAANVPKIADAAVSIVELTSAGNAVTRHSSSGTPSIDELTASGSTDIPSDEVIASGFAEGSGIYGDNTTTANWYTSASDPNEIFLTRFDTPTSLYAERAYCYFRNTLSNTSGKFHIYDDDTQGGADYPGNLIWSSEWVPLPETGLSLVDFGPVNLLLSGRHFIGVETDSNSTEWKIDLAAGAASVYATDSDGWSGDPWPADVGSKNNNRLNAYLEYGGSVRVPIVTASGTATVIHGASGTPSIDELTASANANRPRVWLNATETKSGATEMTVTAWSHTGDSITFTDPVGAPTGSLFLGVENVRNNDIGWIAVTVGTLDTTKTVDGTPSIAEITATSLANVLQGTEGSPTLDVITASGTAVANQFPAASGSIVLDELTVSGTGVALVRRHASGSIELTPLTASGTATGVPIRVTGTPSITDITASGTTITRRHADGTPSLDAVSASGIARANPQRANGTPSIEEITASGTAIGPAAAGGGGGSWDPHRSLVGIKLRNQPFKSKKVEEEIEEAVEEALEEIKEVEGKGRKLSGQAASFLATKKLLARQQFIRNIRGSEELSKRIAELQLEARVNELIRQRRDFLEDQRLFDEQIDLQRLASEAEDRLFIAAEADRKERETARLSEIIERKKVVRQTALRSDKEDMEALVFIISELL